MTVGAVDGSAERLADATARRVIGALHAGAPLPEQHQPAALRGRIRRSAGRPTPGAEPIGPEGGTVDEATAGRIRASSGRPLSTDVRTPMERAFGRDLSHVRLHQSSEVAADLGARAFTIGRDVHLGVGEPSPETAEGEHLLAHELAHVLQGGNSGPVRRFYALVDRKTRQEITAARMTDLQNLYGDHLNEGNPEGTELQQYEWMRDQYNRDSPHHPVDVLDETVHFTLAGRPYTMDLDREAGTKVAHIAKVLEEQFHQMQSPGAPAATTGVRLGDAATEQDSTGRTMGGAISATAIPQARDALALIAHELERSESYREMLFKIVDEPGAAVPLLFGKHSAGAFDNWQTGGVDMDDFAVLPDDPKAGGAALTKGDIMMHVLEERYYMQRRGMSYTQAHYACLAPDSFENRYRKDRGIRTRLVELDECKPYEKKYKTVDDVRHGTFVATDVEGYRTELEGFMSGKASIADTSGVQWDIAKDGPTEKSAQVDTAVYFGGKFEIARADYIATVAGKKSKESIADAEAQLRHWASATPGKVPDAVIAGAAAEIAAIQAELQQIKAIGDADRNVEALTKKRDDLRQVTDLSADDEYGKWKAGYDAARVKKDYVSTSKRLFSAPDVTKFEAFRSATAAGGIADAVRLADEALAAAVLATGPLIEEWYRGDNYFANGRRASVALKSLPWYQDEVKKSQPIRKREGAKRAGAARQAADAHLASAPVDAASKALADLRKTRESLGVPAASSPVNDADPGHATLNCSFVSVAAVFGDRTSGQAADQWAQQQGSTRELHEHQDENAWYVGQKKLDPATFHPEAKDKAEIGDVQWAGIASFLETLPQVKSSRAKVEVVGAPDIGMMTDETTTLAKMNTYPNGSQFVVFLYQVGMPGGHYVYAERYNSKVVFEDYQWNRRDTPTGPIQPRTAYVDKFPNKAITNEPDLYTEASFVAVVPDGPPTTI